MICYLTEGRIVKRMKVCDIKNTVAIRLFRSLLTGYIIIKDNNERKYYSKYVINFFKRINKYDLVHEWIERTENCD